MTSRDVDAAVSRFLSATRRIEAGLTQQRDRVLATERTAPTLLDDPWAPQTKNLTGTFANDVDYYIYELGRLRDLVAVEAPTTFGKQEIFLNALKKFDQAIPHLKAIRNALTH